MVQVWQSEAWVDEKHVWEDCRRNGTVTFHLVGPGELTDGQNYV